MDIFHEEFCPLRDISSSHAFENFFSQRYLGCIIILERLVEESRGVFTFRAKASIIDHIWALSKLATLKWHKERITLGPYLAQFRTPNHPASQWCNKNQHPMYSIVYGRTHHNVWKLQKSLIQHFERTELRLYFEWTKINQKCQNWSILVTFWKTWKLRINSATRQVNFKKDINWWKMPEIKKSNKTFLVIFKQCETLLCL